MGTWGHPQIGQLANYGGVRKLESRRKTRHEVCSMNVSYMWDLIRAWLLPVVVFALVNYLRAMYTYSSNMVSITFCLLIFVVFTLYTLSIDFASHWRFIFTCKTSGSVWPKQNFRLAGFAFVMCCVAWALGFCLGEYNFKQNFEPYWDIKSLNKYPMVDASAYHGQQMLDAGQIEFVPGSHLDLSKSYGFKNGHTYCIAPIVGPTHNKSKGMDNYDFWAVGLDCCSGHTNDFHCGDYANKNARKGLRLMHDSDRDFYRLAVGEARASFKLSATFPIFMYWMEDPEQELQAHYDNGIFNIINGIIGVMATQFVLVIFAALLFDDWRLKDFAADLV